jgi:hypothetical protein
MKELGRAPLERQSTDVGVECEHVGECRRMGAEILQHRIRQLVARALRVGLVRRGEDDEAISVDDRQRPEEPIDETKDGRVRADAQRERMPSASVNVAATVKLGARRRSRAA